ncbi:hypothetical protein GCM10023156_08850 [Novipirellula rosea]|uniref:Uncharacterized protein n=1 Tax=Novipirellula rosea TaxID=1031540 RepID=A0ABP8MCB9_9BACT
MDANIQLGECSTACRTGSHTKKEEKSQEHGYLTWITAEITEYGQGDRHLQKTGCRTSVNLMVRRILAFAEAF